MEYKIAYCFNGWKWMWRQLVLSITTLRKFVKENIVVFYAPPHYQEHINWLENRCDLRLVETPLDDPEFRSKRVHARNRFYGGTMKLHAYALDIPNLIWIDTDTVVLNDITELLEGDFDIQIAPWRPANLNRGLRLMRPLCKEAGLPAMPIMMDGFMVFKNYAHTKMRSDYLAYMKKLFMDELHPPNPDRLCLYAFMLALIKFKQQGGKIKEMSQGIHEYKNAIYVQHLPRRVIATWAEQKIFTEEMYKLVEIGEEKSEW